MQCRLFYCIMENEQRGMNTFILAVCGNVDYVYSFPQSPPSRAAWIEIAKGKVFRPTYYCRRLHGRRGLKYHSPKECVCADESPPSRAAWIEILSIAQQVPRIAKSPPSRAAWIEISNSLQRQVQVKSPPSRAAWIEMVGLAAYGTLCRVAAFTGGVD